MSDRKKNYNRAKNKATGEVKETVGKIIGNEQLELQGKIQSYTSDLKNNWDIGDKIENAKETIAGKINDRIDRNKKKKIRKDHYLSPCFVSFITFLVAVGGTVVLLFLYHLMRGRGRK